ncbi:hypothetical protein C3495_06195 [Clostridiaceae bacterium 14S0207]|nr:hypothetical protein C3495_06195 [Clostridiaceae bacterium 14S0207]
MINVEQHLGLVGMVIKKYFPKRELSYEELFQIGSIGLVKAANDFDERRNVKFSTYAVFKIRCEILRYFREDKWHIGSREQRVKGEAHIPYSLDSTVKEDDDKGFTFLDLEGTDEFEEKLQEKIFLEQLILQLDELERKVIIGLFYEEKLQRELAKEFNLSQCEISRLKIKGLKKMRQAALPSELVC